LINEITSIKGTFVGRNKLFSEFLSNVALGTINEIVTNIWRIFSFTPLEGLQPFVDGAACTSRERYSSVTCWCNGHTLLNSNLTSSPLSVM